MGRSLGWAKTLLGGSAVGVALLFAGSNCGTPVPGSATTTPDADDRPNVLIVLWDTARADRMSLYGHTRATTPRLDAFAQSARVYEHAIAPDMWTLPTHTSMFTGLSGTSHGADATHRWVDDAHHTLAEILHEAGYDTVAISANIVVSPLTNLLQGFDDIITTFKSGNQGKESPFQAAARENTESKLIARDRSTEMSPAWSTTDPDDGWAKAVYKDAGPATHRRFTTWLDAREDKRRPWFGYLNLMEAHTPRVPSEQARKALLDPDLLELGLQTDASLFTEVAYVAGKREYDANQLAALGGVYDATLRDLDDVTGDLLDDLSARGDLNDTLLIIVADHGEALGEHRMMEHRYNVYDQLLHVPLVIRYPGHVATGREANRVSTQSVFATVLDAADIPLPKNPAVRSTSLLAAVPAGPTFAQMLDPFASTLKKVKHMWPDLDTTRLERTYGVVYDGNRKLIRCSDGAHELYDLETDPQELHNLFDAQPNVATTLLGTLSAWEADLTPFTASPHRSRKAKAASNSAAIRELELLGYLTEDGETDVPAPSALPGTGK